MAIFSAAAAPHFDPAEFDRFLAEHGTPAIWRRARLCPCVGASTGQPALDCTVCNGEAIVWEDSGQNITVLLPGRQRQDQYDQVGAWMQGMAYMTFPVTFVPGHLDQVQLTAAEMVVNNERHVRGDVDRAGRSRERLRMRGSLRVEFCEAIVGGSLVAYTEGTDFSIGSGGEIQWQAGAGPATGTAYTMRYVARPTYVVWSPQSRDEAGKTMLYRAMVRRLDFFQRPVVGLS